MSRLYFLFLGLLLAVLSHVTAALTCFPGYEFSPEGACIDENECVEDPPVCGDNTVCYNTNGSYYCNCVTGYQSTSRAVNFTAVEGVECEDINECVENNPICGPNAECINTPASFYCTCRSGFVSSTEQEQFNASQNVTCRDKSRTDKDECEYENPVCGDNAVCYNTEDINECVENKPICGPNAECTNIRGSFYCTCRSGFVSNTGQERFNAGQNVTCRETPDVEHQENSVFCIKAESSAGQQQFNPTVLMILPLILWIMMFYQ